MSALTHRKLAQRLADAQERSTQIVEVERTKDGRYLSILPETPFEHASTEHLDAHWPVVVHDLRGLGPAGFDERTLGQFASHASCCALIPVGADLSIDSVFAGAASILDRVLIVETKLPLYAAWQRYLRQRSPDVPFLPYLPEGVGP
jgi:hypothetical protein